MGKAIFLFVCFISFSALQAQTSRSHLSERIDTTNLNLEQFATQIAGNASTDYEKAKVLLNWLSQRLDWKATDYQQRSVNQILQRGGGNCFELAKVYMALIKALHLPYRPIAEINIHRYSESRQQTAEEKVKEKGNAMSVFGRQHNDHRWLEIFDATSNRWEPVDPSMNVIGVESWLKARVWFGERLTIDTSITNDMIVPFAIFTTGPSKTQMQESRSTYYLVEAFDKLYNYQLSKLPSWKAWPEGVAALQDPARNAFAGTENLHSNGTQIASLATVYGQLKKEYFAINPNPKN
ncbi:transglutaminase-like domain-containing protein [Flavisolibacter tropicus]|uniref:Transglutaminase-like domain-containing protein n=1 Tax=Flavisolibacter tropicus TaxID=1492898 RepID=A0A172TWT9_9BACT|nr:transglutaminase-like domain-containing protein [Flavisolibacter tropicus]ANE51344.1 hypothetical protein SY85_13305 [Flavisolibacter tropicus]